jgi:MFS family permease
MFLWGIGEGIFIYFQPIYLDQLGADPIEIGGFLGLAMLAFALSHIPAGALADTIGRRKIMVLAWFIGATAGLVMFLATSLPIFVFGMVAYSFTGFVMSALQSYVTAARGAWTVTRAMTTTSAFSGIGAIIGPVLGGQLAELFGLQTIYGISTGIFFLSAFTITRLHPQPVESSEGGSRYQNLLKNKALGGFLLLVFVILFGMYLSWPLTPIFLQEERGVTVGSLGLLGSINASGVVLLSLILGRMKPRFGFLVAQLAVGLSVLTLWRGVNQVWFSLGYFLASGFRTSRFLVLAQVETLVNRLELGLAYGLAETINGSVMMIASPIAGILYDLRRDLPFMVSIAILGIALALTLRLTPLRSLSRSTSAGSMDQVP